MSMFSKGYSHSLFAPFENVNEACFKRMSDIHTKLVARWFDLVGASAMLMSTVEIGNKS